MSQINAVSRPSLLSVVVDTTLPKQCGDRPLYALGNAILDGEVLSWDM